MCKNLIATVILIMLAFGCSKEAPNDSEITSVIRQNLKFLENEDVKGYMSTVHEKAAGYAKTRDMMMQIFDTYDLSCKMESIEVIKKSDQEAKVRCVQITRKVSGPAFANNKLRAIHTLRKSNGKWKIYSTAVEKLDVLD